MIKYQNSAVLLTKFQFLDVISCPVECYFFTEFSLSSIKRKHKRNSKEAADYKFNVKIKDDITLYLIDDPDRYKYEFEELYNSKDFSKMGKTYNIKFDKINPKTMSEKEMGDLIRKKIVPMFGEHEYIVIDYANSIKNVIGRYDRFDKDGYGTHDSNIDYSYLSIETINKKIGAYESKKAAEEEKEYKKNYAQACKKFGKTYVDAAINGRVIVGMPEELFLRIYKNCELHAQTAQGKLYYVYSLKERSNSRSIVFAEALSKEVLVYNGKVAKIVNHR